jgi:hypothetical protein
VGDPARQAELRKTYRRELGLCEAIGEQQMPTCLLALAVEKRSLSSAGRVAGREVLEPLRLFDGAVLQIGEPSPDGGKYHVWRWPRISRDKQTRKSHPGSRRFDPN